MEGTVTYRLLPKDEWYLLEDFLVATLPPDTPIPSPSISEVAVAELNGEVVGNLFLQMTVHMDAFAVHPDHTGKVSYGRLAEVLDAYFTATFPPGSGYFAIHQDASRAERMKELGYTLQPFAVYTREV